VLRLPTVFVWSVAPLCNGHCRSHPHGERSSILRQFRGLIGESGGQAIAAMLQGTSSSVGGGWSAVIGVNLPLMAVGVVGQLKDALNTIFEVSEPKNPGVSGT
jgi:uncharacterized BrkB/YihY/UPF0761 family membrane protein